LFLQGHDEEAVVDMGKISSTINTNFEKEELESKFVVVFYLFKMHFLPWDKRSAFLQVQPVLIKGIRILWPSRNSGNKTSEQQMTCAVFCLCAC